jgi:hypothetical protein
MPTPRDFDGDPAGHVLREDGVTRIRFQRESRDDGTVEYSNTDPIHFGPGVGLLDVQGIELTGITMRNGDSLTMTSSITLNTES